ncbi:MAG: thiamine pyrophosphate-dependent dehydrogenase E1 component subunit alpha [Herpetosiphon sp.]
MSVAEPLFSIAATDLGPDDARRIFELMLLARSVDERQWILNRQGKAPFVISCQGHEAAQVGSTFALTPGKDWLLPYYRDLGAVLTIGMSAESVMLGVFARAGDPSSGGRQMPAHYSSLDLNIISQSSPTGTQVPHATGVALAIHLRNAQAGSIVDDAVAWVSFGEGTSSQGEVHESMNLAGTHNLPVIFCCENNSYAISVPQHKQMGVHDVATRAAGYGFPGVVVDGTDPLASYEATRTAVARARRGEGPTLLEFKCERLTPHSSDDNDRTYRSPDEIKAMRQHDPLQRFAAYLVNEGIMSKADEDALRAQVKQQVDIATRAAEAAPQPDPASVLKYVFAPSPEG